MHCMDESDSEERQGKGTYEHSNSASDSVKQDRADNDQMNEGHNRGE